MTRAFCQLVCGVLTLLSWGPIATARQQEPGQPTYPAVSLSFTEVRTVTSSILSRDYEIYVALPWSYRSTEKRYPTLYVTDADERFGLDLGAYQDLHADQEIPELILVGIAYGTGLPNAASTWRSRRTQDFTPSAVTDYPGSGEAAQFSNFIREELIPFIDANYRTDPTDRTLTGGSFGGLFTMFVMLQTPNAFQQYIARSPSLWWDDRMMFALERAYAETHRNLPVTLHTSIGLSENSPTMVEPWQEFVHIMKDRNYGGFRMVATSIPDAKHTTAVGMGLFPGLKAVFGGMTLEPEVLDRYVGRYTLPQGVVVSVTREGQQLWADWNGQRKLKLVARTLTRFSFTTGRTELRELTSGTQDLLPLLGLQHVDFHPAAPGAGGHMTVYQNGQSLDGMREK